MQFNCLLSAKTNNQDLKIFLNFNDLDTRTLNLNNNSVDVSKSYLNTNIYNITAFANITNMSVSDQINGKFT